MPTNATSRGRDLLTLSLVVVAGCSDISGTDPRILARDLPARPRPLDNDAPRPVIAALNLGGEVSAVRPAPLGEVRQAETARPAVSVLIGQVAAPMIQRGVEQAFADGEACKPTTCPDRDAVELMLQGRADFAVIAGDLSNRDQHAGLRQTRLGVELWGIGVAATSPLRSLSRAQLRRVLTGEYRDFSDLDQAHGPISVFVPAETEAGHRAAKALIPGDPLGAMATAVADAAIGEALRAPGAIGVVRVGVTPLPDDVRLLSIDWSPPTVVAFSYGTYPFGAVITLVTSGQPAGPAAEFLAFARSEAGKAAMAMTLLPAQ